MTRIFASFCLLAVVASAPAVAKTKPGGGVMAKLSGHKVCYDDGASSTYGADGSYTYSTGETGTWQAAPGGVKILFTNGQSRYDKYTVKGSDVQGTNQSGMSYHGTICE